MTSRTAHRARGSFTAPLGWLAIGPSHMPGGGSPISSEREEMGEPPPRLVPHPYFKVTRWTPTFKAVGGPDAFGTISVGTRKNRSYMVPSMSRFLRHPEAPAHHEIGECQGGMAHIVSEHRHVCVTNSLSMFRSTRCFAQTTCGRNISYHTPMTVLASIHNVEGAPGGLDNLISHPRPPSREEGASWCR